MADTLDRRVRAILLSRGKHVAFCVGRREFEVTSIRCILSGYSAPTEWGSTKHLG